ncbi:MAG: potassium channel protein [Phycisphaerae bacterium]|nr:potassium channel protein [Phycisphaerae bacterium]
MKGFTRQSSIGNPMRVVLAISILLAVIAVGTLGFKLIGNRDLLDCLYMTLATISTLGMKAGQTPPINQPERIWIIVLIVVGIAAATVAISTLVSMIVEGQMRTILGRRKVDRKIASLSGHTIICGYGRMGKSVCECLKNRDITLVIIDSDPDKTTDAEAEHLLYVLGDASEEKTLENAGLERASSLIAVLDTDAHNVFVSLIARDMNPKIKIAARAEKPESQSRLRRAGANHVICPHDIGAARLANLLTRPGIVNFIDLASKGMDIEAEQRTIDAGNLLEGITIKDANIPGKTGALIIALQRGDNFTMFNPRPDTVLKRDDVMFLTGPVGSMSRVEQEFFNQG